MESEGESVVSGLSHNGSSNDFALTRHNASGTMDRSVGAGGKVHTDFNYSN